jgi:hypothetical protein
MINQPDMQKQEPQSGKLILPAPPEEQQMYNGSQKVRLRPEQLIRPRTGPAPKGTLARLAYYWHKDPAYKVLMIAMVMVLLAGIVFLSLATTTFLGNPNFFASSSSPPPNPPTGVNPTGTVDLRPSFPTPGGGNGSNQSSQPPMQQTPALQPTGTTNPNPSGGALAVQITTIPLQVVNNSRVDVVVNTSEPGASVLLVIRYNVQPYRATAGPQIADSNGNATVPWFVFVFSFGHRSVQATVVAIATDQNGQQAKSQPAIVQVLTG